MDSLSPPLASTLSLEPCRKWHCIERLESRYGLKCEPDQIREIASRIEQQDEPESTIYLGVDRYPTGRGRRRREIWLIDLTCLGGAGRWAPVVYDPVYAIVVTFLPPLLS